MRLIGILGEIGQQHREATVSLLMLVTTTRVTEVREAAVAALMRINLAGTEMKLGRGELGS